MDRNSSSVGAQPPIFLISMVSDRERRVDLSRQFPSYYRAMILVDAVDGSQLDARAYFKKIFPAVSSGYRMMSPSEVGCTLSHIEAMKKFLDSGRPSALIVEDDIIGTDSDLDSVLINIKDMPEESVIIFGGQEGMPSRKYIFGKPSDLDGVFRLPRYSNSFVLRTCCYGVTRTSAKAILNAHNEYLKLADAWGLFFEHSSIKILFAKKLHHPVDRSASHIEKSRALLRKGSKFSIQEVLKKRFLRIRRKYGALICYLTGYRRVG